MPGKYIDDFEVGQWVGIAFNDENFRKVGKIVGFAGSSIHVAFYDSSGKLIPGETEGHKKMGSTISWSYPSSLYTAKETEDILYHCSYCGKEGHNRRTCDQYAKDSGLTISGDSEPVYVKGLQVNPDSISDGDKFMVVKPGQPTNAFSVGLFERMPNSSYVRGKVLANAGDTTTLGPVGKEWNFDKGDWEFYLADVMDSSAEKDFKILDLWDLIDVVLPASRLTLLYGPPGTGKTTAGNFLGNPEKVYNITLTEETPAAELRGHFVPKGQEFVWMDGPALSAFKNGARLVLNEIDKASGDALTFCHALLDDPGIAKITLPYKGDDGEPVSVTPHPDFHVVATMNGEPDDLPEALRDRFAVRIEVKKVHPDAIKRLPEDLRKVASKGVSKDGDRSVSIRGWNAFVHLREMIGEDSAAQAVFGDRAKTILNTIKIDGLSAKKKK